MCHANNSVYANKTMVYRPVPSCVVSLIVAPAVSTAHTFSEPCSVSTGTVAILVSGIIMSSYQGDRLSQISSPSNGSFYSQLPDQYISVMLSCSLEGLDRIKNIL